MNDETLQEMIRSSSNAEDVREFASRTGLEVSSSELRAVAAVVDFRSAGIAQEASASRRAAFLGRVALQRTVGQTGRPSNPWIRRRMALAAASVAALGMVALGGANAEGVGNAVAEALGLRDDKLVYHTTSFEPAFSVTLPDDVSVTVAVDKGDAFLPGRSFGFGKSPGRYVAHVFLFGIYRPLAWADPAGEARFIIPSDKIAWLQGHPCLDAGEPESSVDIGGLEATQIDATWTCVPSAPGEEALFYLENPLFLIGPDERGCCGPGGRESWLSISIAPSGVSTASNIGLGLRYRFWVLRVQGEDLVIIAPAPGQEVFPGDFEQIVRPMLDSLTFK